MQVSGGRTERGRLKQCVLQRHSTENPKQILPEKELCGHSPKFPHSCVRMWCDVLYILPGTVCLFCCRKIYSMWTDPGNIYVNRSETYECGIQDRGREISFL
jgi:hypothetical protein